MLDTTIVAPHEAAVTDMCFCQASDSQTTLLLSASKDGRFKAWQLATQTEGKADTNQQLSRRVGLRLWLIPRSPTLTPADGGPSWSCDFVGAYRGLVPECCCFSADGSLLAVGFQEVVTVWSPVSWELLTTLSQPPNPIRSEPKLRSSVWVAVAQSSEHMYFYQNVHFSACAYERDKSRTDLHSFQEGTEVFMCSQQFFCMIAKVSFPFLFSFFLKNGGGEKVIQLFCQLPGAPLHNHHL